MWKSDWNNTKNRFINWWDHKGVLVGMWGGIKNGNNIHEVVNKPKQPSTLNEQYSNAELRAEWNHYNLSCEEFPLDILPLTDCDIGPGSLALYLGCEPKFAEDTIWFEQFYNDKINQNRKLVFDPDNKWWKITKETLLECRKRSQNKYLVGCPDLIENLDILASLRGTENLMMDMLDRPDWVKEKISEINDVWFMVYDEIYDIIKLEDGSSCFGPFKLWGPDKTVKVQCDESAMISTGMFREFVQPSLSDQCKKLNNTLYHLDGTAAIKHLDVVLEIDSLKAIEWTPEAGIESGGDKRWYEMYKRILNAGKSLQAVNVKHEEILPLIDAVGDNGLYILCEFNNIAEAEKVSNIIEKYL
jgi:hypothetical protein